MTTKPRTKLYYRPWLILIIGIYLIFVVRSGMIIWEDYRLVEEAMSELSQQKEALLQEQERLYKEIERLNSPEYIEALARDELGLVRKGEIIIQSKKKE